MALKYREQLAAEPKLWSFAVKFFEEQFDPLRSVSVIAEHLAGFILAKEPGAADLNCYAQILFREKQGGQEHLAIRGSSDPDGNPGLTRVSIDDSVCGLLVKDPGRGYILCDPTTDPECRHLYKRYLGKDGKEKEDIRSELAIALKDGGEVFAVVNLESKAARAFNPARVDKFIERAMLFVPMLRAIKSRIESNSLAQSSTLLVLESYLGLLGTQYLHSLRTPSSALAEGLALLRQRLSESDQEVRATVADIQEAAATIYKLQQSFAVDITDFATQKRHDLKKLLEDAIRLCNKSELERSSNIRIECDIAAGVEVECSLFLKQVFYNIIRNSIIWLQRKQNKQPGHKGVITVKLDAGHRPDPGEEVGLNLFCEVRIHDNGPGVSEEDRGKILNNAFTLLGSEGTGFGLYAANQYVLSLGGKLRVESILGECFEVVINLRRVADEPVGARADQEG